MSRFNISFKKIIILLLIFHSVINIIMAKPPFRKDIVEEDPEENTLCPSMRNGEIVRQPWDKDQAIQYNPNPQNSGLIQHFNTSTNTTAISDCFDDTGVVIKIGFK